MTTSCIVTSRAAAGKASLYKSGTFNPEFDLAFSLHIKGMILATTDVIAGMEFGPSLAYQDIAWNYSFTAILLHA